MSIGDAAALRAAVGSQVGPSGWVRVDQPLIDGFAQLTGDQQWIHVDTERAAAQAPGGTTIAHGYLTLSLVSRLLNDILDVAASSGLNYGIERLRFLSPVPSGARVRLVATVKEVTAQGRGWRACLGSSVEIEGAERAALVADLIFLFYFAGGEP